MKKVVLFSTRKEGVTILGPQRTDLERHFKGRLCVTSKSKNNKHIL